MSMSETTFFSTSNSAYDFVPYSSTEEAVRSSTPEYMEITTHKQVFSSNHSVKKRSLVNINHNKRYVRRGRIVKCHNARQFRTARERWWFIAVSNCNGSKGIHLKYRILMTNGAPGDYWHEHFSADEFYILPVLMAFAIAYSFLMLGIVVCSIELKSRQLLHTTYKIFVFSSIVQLFAILFVCSCYLKLAVTGLLETKIKRFGMILMSISETSFVLLLLLLAKGFTITRGRLPLPASIKLTIFMCVYAVIYLSLFVYEAKVFDPGEVLYLYESPAGYGLIILRVLAWCMFIYSTIFTLKYYPEKVEMCNQNYSLKDSTSTEEQQDGYQEQNTRDLRLENVLKWSIAKNVPTIETQHFERTGTKIPSSGDLTVGIHKVKLSPSYIQDKVQQEETEEINIDELINDPGLKRMRIHPTQNKMTNNSNMFNIPSRESSFKESQPRAQFEDYIRDVPIELFTVSKMIVTTNNFTKRNIQKEESD
ncbi:unnamed protein product [Phaedon cochleariae]|uniref:Intimal thickness related receptor IRP domain-containing protein n=1 Tax=Phaedon cochleariae TaxID=80249 RepID=A0A9P0GQW6_PHACE|nr:unnamed protein product [Phaedon cochleariae]